MTKNAIVRELFGPPSYFSRGSKLNKMLIWLLHVCFISLTESVYNDLQRQYTHISYKQTSVSIKISALDAYFLIIHQAVQTICLLLLCNYCCEFFILGQLEWSKMQRNIKQNGVRELFNIAVYEVFLFQIPATVIIVI